MPIELETYQKLNLLNASLAGLSRKGRPPKWYKNIIDYLRDPHIGIPFFCPYGEPIYYHIEDIYNFINTTDAGSVNNIYFIAGFSVYGEPP